MNYLRWGIVVSVVCALALTASLLAYSLTRPKMNTGVSSSSRSTTPAPTATATTVKSAITNTTISHHDANYQSSMQSTSKSTLISNTFTIILLTGLDRSEMQTSTVRQPSYWMMDAVLNYGRFYQGVMVLANAHVLVAGGLLDSSTITDTSEIYSSTDGWQRTSSMNVLRDSYTLTPFANNTKALAAGGELLSTGATAEIFDSATNTWTFTSGNMLVGRFYHSATLLGNGHILIAGGFDTSFIATTTAEIYIPSADSFVNTGSMNSPRCLFTSTLLSDGLTVLVTGGVDENNDVFSTAELYINRSWTYTSGNMTRYRTGHTAILLNDGKVLIVGGNNGGSVSFASAEIYNPATRTFTAVRSMKYAREAPTLTLLPSGQMLVVGGLDFSDDTYSVVCELYDPVTKSWSDGPILNYGRINHRTVLMNNSLLTIGGRNTSGIGLVSSERYNL